ncbi:hypothetical protein WJX77_010452 [Trebouxia sp. C0004]
MMKIVVALAPATTADFKAMRKMRDAVKSKMAQALSDFRNMQQRPGAGTRAAADAEKYAKYTKEATVEETQIVDAPYHSTLCSTCRTVCHDHCSLQEITTPGAAGFGNCSCFGHGRYNGGCGVCTGHCAVSSHYHARKTIKQVTRTVSSVLEDMKRKYRLAAQQALQARNQQSRSKVDMLMIRKAQDSKMAEIKHLCRGVRDICSSFNLVEELNTVLASLTMEAKHMQSVKACADGNSTVKELTDFVDNVSKEEPVNKPKGEVYDYGLIKVEELDLSDDENKDSLDNKTSRRKSALRDSTSSSSSSHDTCQAFARGRCEQGTKRRLKHLVNSYSSSDSRSRPQMHQAQPNGRVCYDFAISGRCRFGVRCQFEHDPAHDYSEHDTAGVKFQGHGQHAGSHNSLYYADRYGYGQDLAYDMDSRYGGSYRHLYAWEAPRGPPLPPPVPRQARRVVLPITLPVDPRDNEASGPTLHPKGCMRRWWSLTRSLLIR